MKIGDRVRVVGCPEILNGRCKGEIGKISARGVLYSFIVTFDVPLIHTEDLVWEDMPFHEHELELIDA